MSSIANATKNGNSCKDDPATYKSGDDIHEPVPMPFHLFSEEVDRDGNSVTD